MRVANLLVPVRLPVLYSIAGAQYRIRIESISGQLYSGLMNSSNSNVYSYSLLNRWCLDTIL